MNNFCSEIYSNKKIIKCVPLLDKKCYVFIGNHQNKYIVENIKKDIQNDNPFSSIEKINGWQSKVKNIHIYLTNKEIDDIDEMKQDIIDLLFIPGHETIFINDLIYNDDTNEKVLMKISEYCYNINEPTPSKYIFSYYTTNENTILSLNIDYPDNRFDFDMVNKDPCDLIDEGMINKDGEQKMIEKTNVLLNLFENNEMKDNIIKYISLKEYLDNAGIFDDIQGSIMNACEIKSFYNGMIYKYWPKVNFDEIANYRIFHDERLIKKQSETVILKQYTDAMKLINRKKSKEVICDSFEINYMRIINKSDELNNINISKLFNETKLNENVPFIKLVLDSHNEKYYKLLKDSIIYNGLEGELNDNQVVDKELCKEWSDDFFINSKYKNSVDFIHPNNIIIFKVYRELTKDIYCSLIIHINGDIECIIKQRKNIKPYRKTNVKAREDIIDLLKYCNKLINIINKYNISEFPINDFGEEERLEDIFENKGNLIIDFLNCSLLFDKHNHKVEEGLTNKEVYKDYNDEYAPFKIGNQLPNWVNLIGNLMSKLPMFFRIKVEEKDKLLNEDRIIGHYTRVNNYANLSTIHSTISAYSNIYEPEEIIAKISKDFGKSPEEMKEEYELWNETTKMREKHRENINTRKVNTYNLNIEENGPDINIHKKTSDRYLQIDITNVKSFNELNRIIYVINSILDMYGSYINNRLPKRNNNFFESDDIIEYEPNIEESENEGTIIGDIDRELDVVELLDSVS